jgi:hypothetical protein
LRSLFGLLLSAFKRTHFQTGTDRVQMAAKRLISMSPMIVIPMLAVFVCAVVFVATAYDGARKFARTFRAAKEAGKPEIARELSESLKQRGFYGRVVRHMIGRELGVDWDSVK